jgi:hypothetical protein
MDMAETVREAVAREVEPLLLRCAAIDAELDRSEAMLPILIYDHPEHDALQARRAKLAKVIGELQIDRLTETILRHFEKGG